MNYANANNQNNNACYHCGNAIAKHAINLIRSDDATTTLAQRLQGKLDDIYERALLKGYELPQGMIMVGAVIATVGTARIQAAALSGGNANAILNLIQGGLGKDVALVGDNVPLASFKSLIGVKLQAWVTDVDNSRTAGGVSAGTLPAVLNQPNYPVGSCAAQKLIDFVIRYALAKSQKINAINLAEIFWKTNGVKSQWSSGDVVPSCNTCQYVLPMMLCNYDEMLDKVRYP